jgi:tRNA nucleotidyltransferase (CCA-adding enzyme)
MRPSAGPEVVTPLDALEPPLPQRLAQVAAAAAGRAWLVGGAVRDLLLGRPAGDIDVVIEGSAVDLARRLPADIVSVSQFQTAVVRWPDGAEWDLVTARRERYAHPAALPAVEPAGIADDLRRRDFTVNALAASLAPANWGAVLDVCGGLDDLAARRLRVLHPASFADDPTRALRLARYQVRLGFEIELETRAAAVRDGDRYLPALSGERLRHDLERSLGAPDGAAQARALSELDLLPAIHPGLRWQPELAEATEALLSEIAVAEPWLVRLLAFLPRRDGWRWLGQLAWRLSLSSAQAAILEGLATITPRHWPTPRGSTVARRLDGRPPESLLAFAARRPSARASVIRYLAEWRYVAPRLDGHAVLALGCQPGPRVGQVLRALRDAWLDGAVKDVEQERALAARLVAKR